MKTIRIALFIVAIAAIATIYSTDAFVPEIQGIEGTVDGLAVISDAEMAQQVGGPAEGWPDLTDWGTDNRASCYGYDNRPIDERPACPMDRQVYRTTTHTCRTCDSQTWYYPVYRDEPKAEEMVSWCLNQSEGCFYTEAPHGDDGKMSCEEFVAPMCNPSGGDDNS